MSFKLYGTQYGGWGINLGLVPEKSTVVSAGIGEDISFDLELMTRRSCKIIGIDPTHKSHIFIENQNLNNFTLIKKALHHENDDIISIYRNKRSDHVSESILPDHHSVKGFDSYYTETISLEYLFERYKNVSVVKMDIEGSEYNVFKNLNHFPDSVKQVCVEFHHFCSDKTIEDTRQVIKKMAKLGFENFVEKTGGKELSELTFWRM